MPGAEPYAAGLSMAASAVPKAAGSGEPHSAGIPVAASASTKEGGSVSTEAAGLLSMRCMQHALRASALADQSGMAIPWIQPEGDVIAGCPILPKLCGAGKRATHKSSLWVRQVYELGLQPNPTSAHSPLQSHCPSFAAFAEACGSPHTQNRSTRTYKLSMNLLLPTCTCMRARASNPAPSPSSSPLADPQNYNYHQ